MTDEQSEKLLAKAEQEWADQLPPWAEGFAVANEMAVGTQLCTRDGRITGNAWVVEQATCWGINLYVVRTDAGNELALSIAEIDELFHTPKYVGSMEDINKKFPRLRDRK